MVFASLSENRKLWLAYGSETTSPLGAVKPKAMKNNKGREGVKYQKNGLTSFMDGPLTKEVLKTNCK